MEIKNYILKISNNNIEFSSNNFFNFVIAIGFFHLSYILLFGFFPINFSNIVYNLIVNSLWICSIVFIYFLIRIILFEIIFRK